MEHGSFKRTVDIETLIIQDEPSTVIVHTEWEFRGNTFVVEMEIFESWDDADLHLMLSDYDYVGEADVSTLYQDEVFIRRVQRLMDLFLGEDQVVVTARESGAQTYNFVSLTLTPVTP